MRFVFLLFTLFVCTNLTAQRYGNPALSEGTELKNQYDTIIDLSNRYREGQTEFKVVRREYLDAFMENVSDSIATYTERIDVLEGEKKELQDNIDGHANEVGDRDKTIADLNSERDSVNLFGLQIDKSTYHIIMWSLVIGLLAAMLIALASTRVAAANNTELKRERDKMSEELEQSRRSRLTVEQELRRQLQNEINRRMG